MYQNILVPTDGSKLSTTAVKTAVRLAKVLGARVTGVYCIPPFQAPMYMEGFAVTVPSTERQRAAAKKAGTKALSVIESAARAAAVPYRSAMLASNTPWEGILKTAKAKRCDLIVMASHGRRGLAGVLLGSETTKVLTHSRVPVLVCR
jgi:nucleotide-binding universal stress UspA family protein